MDKTRPKAKHKRLKESSRRTSPRRHTKPTTMAGEPSNSSPLPNPSRRSPRKTSARLAPPPSSRSSSSKLVKKSPLSKGQQQPQRTSPRKRNRENEDAVEPAVKNASTMFGTRPELRKTMLSRSHTQSTFLQRQQQQLRLTSPASSPSLWNRHSNHHYTHSPTHWSSSLGFRTSKEGLFGVCVSFCLVCFYFYHFWRGRG
eukprot:m.104006 g.104006  ORF g.104006 m.104006 type:complete len:200 (+) comp22428_c1_seq3:289-888(+)